jgi:hypothetical protein
LVGGPTLGGVLSFGRPTIQPSGLFCRKYFRRARTRFLDADFLKHLRHYCRPIPLTGARARADERAELSSVRSPLRVNSSPDLFPVSREFPVQTGLEAWIGVLLVSNYASDGIDASDAASFSGPALETGSISE